VGKKWKKGKSQAKPKTAATVKHVPQIGYPKSTPPANSAPTSQSQSEEDRGREPTETEVVALMHDDDLIEYSSSSPSDRRRNSMFEFYKQQWKVARAAEERSKKVEALRQTFNPNAKARIRFITKLREASKVGTVYMSDWVVLGLIVAAALGFGGVALSEHLYTLAYILFFFGIGLFIVKAIYDHRNHELKTALMVFFIVIGGVAFLSLVGWVEWDRRHEKRQDASTTNASAPEVKQPSKTGATQPQDDLRAALRADGNRAIRLVTVRVNLKRKYSIEEIGHFRLMYEVARITDRTTPEFYLASQDYYDVNKFVDPKIKQFGYRWTVRYRDPNNTYRPTPSFIKGRQYGATTGLTPSTDVLEFSVDLYNQIPSDRIL
jgi:uncharacterized membrane protein YtjA (UPF0391 family)